jgi:signal transduction histidine kinase
VSLSRFSPDFMTTTDIHSVFREEETLARFAQIIAEQPFTALNPEELHQEYGRLGGSYNALLKQMIAMTRISDVSQTKLFRLQQDLKKTLKESEANYTKSKEANTRKTELLSVVAHDLKSPLATILAIVKLIELGDITAAEFPEAGASIRQTCERMIDLIESLLATSALEMGKMEVKKSLQKIFPILERVVKENRIRADAKGQTIFFNAEEEPNAVPNAELLAVELFIDSNLIHQVLENVMSNAVKYSPHDASIHVRMLTTPEDILRIEVQDEGQGLSDKDKAKLFGYFQRLSAMPTGGESSHGVGLAITKRMVELHDGAISVESELGKGATFIVELPMAMPDRTIA